jgi:hypothetical protein
MGEVVIAQDEGGAARTQTFPVGWSHGLGGFDLDVDELAAGFRGTFENLGLFEQLPDKVPATFGAAARRYDGDVAVGGGEGAEFRQDGLGFVEGVQAQLDEWVVVGDLFGAGQQFIRSCAVDGNANPAHARAELMGGNGWSRRGHAKVMPELRNGNQHLHLVARCSLHLTFC